MKQSILKLWMLSILLIGLNSAKGAAVAPRAKDILAPFQQMTLFKGEFEQRKTLAVLKHPFISTGKFLSVKGHGLVWNTLTPLPSVLIMTPGEVTQVVNGRTQTFPATGTGYDGLAILLPALLDGDMKSLENYFNVNTTGSVNQWSLKLFPKDDKLSSIIKSVSVTGSSNTLNSISLIDPDQGKTLIHFQSITMSKEAPDAADLAHFKPSS